MTTHTLRQFPWHRIAAHALGIAPFIMLLVATATGRTTANPIQFYTHQTGENGLRLLVLSLACTPLNTLFGWRWTTQIRRPLGLYGFALIALHFFIFLVLDYGLDLSLIWQELAEKRYIIAGFAGFVLLVPLAITSTKGWQRRLGKTWKQLHWLVYPALLLGILHYVWLVKADITGPLIYGAVVALLLVLRLAPVKRAIVRFRTRSTSPA